MYTSAPTYLKEMLFKAKVVLSFRKLTSNLGQTTSVLTATILEYAIGAGITAGAGH